MTRAWLVLVLATGCAKSKPESVPDAGASPKSVESAQNTEPPQDESVHSVYPDDAGAIDPIVDSLCNTLREMPEARRAACCNEKPGITFLGECRRMLGAALNAKAVTLDKGAVDTCVAAMDKAYAGCDWPGPFLPELPEECLGLVRGTLPAGARCRSNLECAGDLRCHGVGPTAAGRCGPAHADGEKCGGATDALVAYARQDDTDKTHPECTGFCDRKKCTAIVPIGGACTSGVACGKAQCVGGKCTSLVAPKLGEACPGGVCDRGLLCLQGKCEARKKAGSSCGADFECVGGCLRREAGASGVCGKKCGVR
jgi:hypothetical protein